MKNSLWGFLIITVGIFAIVVLFFVYKYTFGSESDYYNLKETTEAAMLDSVDTFALSLGEVEINKEKFMENFIRRFSETTNYDQVYKIEFFDISEKPPKVSVRITTKTGEYTYKQDTVDAPIVNKIDAILEQKNN